MDDFPPNQDDMRGRLRAALEFADRSRAHAALTLNVSPETLYRMLGKKGDEIKAVSWTDIWKIAALCEDAIPVEFFTADLSRLHEIVPPGAREFRRPELAAPPAPPSQPRRPRVVPPPTGDKEAGPSQSEEPDSP